MLVRLYVNAWLQYSGVLLLLVTLFLFERVLPTAEVAGTPFGWHRFIPSMYFKVRACNDGVLRDLDRAFCPSASWAWRSLPQLRLSRPSLLSGVLARFTLPVTLNSCVLDLPLVQSPLLVRA